MKNIKEVNAVNAHAMLKKGALLLDVRESFEVSRETFDVPDVKHIPMRELEQRLHEIPAKRQIIIACRSGSRSMMAARMLMSRGYHKVANLQHGVMGWQRAGLPMGKLQKQHGDSLLVRFLKLFKRS